MANVKGSALASRILWVRLNHGEAALAELAAHASEPLAAVLIDGAVMAEWYPLDVFIELNELLDRTYGAGDNGLVRTLGRHGADANLRTIYRLFYKVGTVKWILARASRLWGMHYDSGELLVDSLPHNQVHFRIVDFDTPHRVHCLAVQGWAERSVELSGGSSVNLEELSCRASGDDSCEFNVTWE